MKDKQISVVHLVYGCIIALLIITFTLAIAFGGHKDAGNQMNVMATGISVVLAVIAILMTLVDVAGQRQSIVDIKETAEKLAESQSISQETIQKSIETLEELIDFREKLLKSVSDYRTGTEGLIKELFNKEKQSISKEELDELLSEFNKKTSDLDSKVNIIAKGERVKSEGDIINYFKKWVRNKYPDQSRIEISEFYDEVRRFFTRLEYKTIKNYLSYKSDIYYDSQENKHYINLDILKEVIHRGATRPII
ncbi:hypothetical protein GZ55_12960 [Bacillus pumilus]|nr:hypothetical protein [Bacillus pumilus]QKN78658.1 hypothetical protein GZ55_12960 [Bacillus pumilus]QLI45388.1 hypothetical protein DJ67_014020 [Bacillus pumilus]